MRKSHAHNEFEKSDCNGGKGRRVDAMKCQRCEKPATFHITELTGGKPDELHLCEDCAKQYLTQAEDSQTPAQPGLANVLASQLALGQTADELARLDQESCPICGITFYEFRNQGRLGCPHDYVCFAQQLEPLLVNIHGETEHKGKRHQGVSNGTDARTELIRLRREMKEAIREELYERASQIRDQIRTIESQKRS